MGLRLQGAVSGVAARVRKQLQGAGSSARMMLALPGVNTARCRSFRACRADLPGRLTYFEIRVGDVLADPTANPSANALCTSYDAPPESIYTLACSPPVTGRYLYVRLRPEYSAQRAALISPASGDTLTLCEVQAFGMVAPTPRHALHPALVCARTALRVRLTHLRCAACTQP